MPAPTPTTIFSVTPGMDADLPLQCKDRTGRNAIYQAADQLSVTVRATGATGDMPSTGVTVDWNTLGGNQTGYDQGQIKVALPGSFTANLQTAITYRVNVFRQLGSNPNRKERCASALVIVDPLA